MGFIKDFFTGNLGIGGEFAYGTTHLVSTLLLIIITAVLCVIGKRSNSKVAKNILISVAWFQIGFEIFWRVLYLFMGNSLANIYPIYPCNLAGILIPIAVLTKNKTLKDLFYWFGLLGSVLTFALPQGIFTRNVLTFSILKSILQHTALIFIPIYELVIGSYKPKLKHYWLCICGILVHIVNSELIAWAIGKKGDYLFFRSDMPFAIPGFPQFIIVSLSGLLIMFLIYLSMNIPETIRFFKKKSGAYNVVSVNDIEKQTYLINNEDGSVNSSNNSPTTEENVEINKVNKIKNK